MPVSYQDYVLYSQATGAPLPRNPQERMQMAPQVYDFTRQIGSRPSRLQQGLRAVGRGLAVAGGAGLAIGVANSLFNKPSDNYRQSVTNNQTTVGKDARTATQTTYDEANTTVAEGLTGQIDQYLSNPIGPHPVGTETHRDQNFLLDPSGQAGRRSRMAKLSGQEFSPSLRYGNQDANIAAFKAENEAALRGESPKAVTGDTKRDPLSKVRGVYGPVDRSQIPGQHGMSLTEEEVFRLKTGQSRATYGNTPKTKEERRYQYKNPLITNQDELFARDENQRVKQDEYNRTGRGMEDQFQSAMDRDTYVPPSNDNDPPLTDKVEQFINKTKSGKNLPEKKTPKISNIGEGTQLLSDIGSAAFKSMAQGGDMGQRALEQTPDIDLSEIENDPALADIGRREEPKDISPRGVIPPDKSGTMNKTDLGAIGDIIGEKQSDNPIVGGLQGIGKAARIADKLGRRTVEELADKGAKDRRSYAKLQESIRKAEAFKKIAEDRENTEIPE